MQTCFVVPPLIDNYNSDLVVRMTLVNHPWYNWYANKLTKRICINAMSFDDAIIK